MNEHKLPKLNYEYDALEPHISEEQLKIHHTIHHQGYVNGANTLLDKLHKARGSGEELDMKSVLKSLAFNLAGHKMHSLFWGNLAPNAGGAPKGVLAELIKKDFGSFQRFKSEFSNAAATVEGSGWAALAYSPVDKQLLVMQLEKHAVNFYPEHKLLMVLDVWEHAYYLDYKNARAKFIEAFWNIVNWDEVSKRLGQQG